VWFELFELVDAGSELVDTVVEAIGNHGHDAALVDGPRLELERDSARAQRGGRRRRQQRRTERRRREHLSDTTRAPVEYLEAG
jgi:hypothetical protein